MRLIFIYGPPAVGKYTTGKELAEITNFKFFHNHLTVPAIDSIMEPDTEERFNLLKKVRLLILSKAAEKDIDTIFTMAYSGKIDDGHIDEIVAAIRKYQGQICFVELYAPKDELLKRVGNKSRKELRLNKPTTKKRLLELLSNRDHYSHVKYDLLRIDTTKSPAKQSAARIVKHFNLF